MLYVCVGQAHTRLPMLACTAAEELYETALAHMRAGERLALERDAGHYTAIYNEHELLLACRLAAEHHNDILAERAADDGWADDTARIWERALLPDDDDSEPVGAAQIECETPRVRRRVQSCARPSAAFLQLQATPLFAPLPTPLRLRRHAGV